MSPASSLRKRIVWLLAIKLVALVVIRQLFFSGEHRVEMDAQQVENRLFAEEQVLSDRAEGE